ncbi:hypothetical protein [Streptomyces niveus]|uniref:Relaxase/mobilization nuclease n=1 Tax=Streptomyces niveus TaxID=193462 RepID=A0A1U9QML2_STRNV|nr:hypothetical protein [Streptomyces niveus]AQU64895.1 hypothetical protein BBN63_00020 [Streptomyces niveus]
MIPYVHERGISSVEALAEALGRPVSDQEGLTTDHTVVAHWPGLDYYTQDDLERIWTSVEWAGHLHDPLAEFPSAVSASGDRRAVFHAHVVLHPGDRILTVPEWSETAHRLARAAGIADPGDDVGCRWIAVQAQPCRLDLIANLIRQDGMWQPLDQVNQRITAEARRIEHELDLHVPYDARPASPNSRRGPADPVLPDTVSVSAQIGRLLGQITEETTGPLATVRGLIEHAAHRLGSLPDSSSVEAGYRLEWAARRLFALQQDLDHMASTLREPARRTGTMPVKPAEPVPARAPAAHRTR